MSLLLSKIWTHIISFTHDPSEIDTIAYPGLMTLLDVALYRSNEGGLTRTVSSTNVVLGLFFELKRLARDLLENVLKFSDASDWSNSLPPIWLDLAESFARVCLECSSTAIERITTDKLASSANLDNSISYIAGSSGNNSSSAGNSSCSSIGGVEANEGVVESLRASHNQRRTDFWESPRLFCPDYIWAEDVLNYCQRLLRALGKHRFLSVVVDRPIGLASLQNITDAIMDLMTKTLPARLVHFRIAMEADSILTKRLYLVKCEYRAPFRAFLEAHANVQRAPRLHLLQEYLKLHTSNDTSKLESKTLDADNRLSSILKHPNLVTALQCEQQCEISEVSMARMLLPFAELARYIDSKKGRPYSVPSQLNKEDLPKLRELLRRLKLILTRKVGQEASTGIRPILLDLQGSPRQLTPSISPFGSDVTTMSLRLQSFLSQLQLLYQIAKIKGAFITQSDKKELDIPIHFIRECAANLDTEMFSAQYEDWYSTVTRQHELFSTPSSLLEISEQLRQAEIEVSIAKSNPASLLNVQQRIETCEKDRLKRFEVLKSITQDICSREMNLKLNLLPLDKDVVLEFPYMKHALGIFGPLLSLHRENLPLG